MLNWKDAMRAFRDHEKSKCYKEAIECMVQIPATTPDVGEMFVVQLSQQKQQNREMLLHILWAVHALTRQGLLLRSVTCKASEIDTWHINEPESNLQQLSEFMVKSLLLWWMRQQTALLRSNAWWHFVEWMMPLSSTKSLLDCMTLQLKMSLALLALFKIYCFI